MIWGGRSHLKLLCPHADLTSHPPEDSQSNVTLLLSPTRNTQWSSVPSVSAEFSY
jgi:hypothetical protein